MKQLILILALALSINAIAQDAEKTITLVVSGQGKTQDEAKQVALRSAIEQAFGAFISSSTVMNNDTFVSENITSLSQGSIVEFNILSSTLLPDTNYTITLKAVVSVSKMQKVIENKGHSATIEGGLFGLNIKLSKLQASAEVKVITDLIRNSAKILSKSIDYKIELIPPKKSDLRVDLQSQLREGMYTDYWKNTEKLSFNEMYKIRMIVEAKPNSNLDVFIDYFMKTLSDIKMSDSEIDFAKQSGNEYYPLNIHMNGNSVYCFRNKQSLELIKYLFAYTTMNTLNYDIVSNDSIINYTPFFKKNINVKNVPENYSLFMNNIDESIVDVIDSSHYVLVNGFLSYRQLSCSLRPIDEFGYPTQLNFNDRSKTYQIYLFKTNVEMINMKSYLDTYSSYSCDQIIYRAGGADATGDKTAYKVLPVNNINVRFQVLDYYLPLIDVEKLNEVKVFPHKSL
jgi:hypothetical protein